MGCESIGCVWGLFFNDPTSFLNVFPTFFLNPPFSLVTHILFSLSCCCFGLFSSKESIPLCVYDSKLFYGYFYFSNILSLSSERDLLSHTQMSILHPIAMRLNSPRLSSFPHIPVSFHVMNLLTWTLSQGAVCWRAKRHFHTFWRLISRHGCKWSIHCFSMLLFFIFSIVSSFFDWIYLIFKFVFQKILTFLFLPSYHVSHYLFPWPPSDGRFFRQQSPLLLRQSPKNCRISENAHSLVGRATVRVFQGTDLCDVRMEWSI